MEVDADEIATQLRRFMEQMSDLEGAETGSGAAVSASADDVGFNPDRFLKELEKLLDGGRKAGGRGETGQTEEEEEDDGGETSSEEGSSFFSSDYDSACDSEVDGDGEAEEVMALTTEPAGPAGNAGLHARSSGGPTAPATTSGARTPPARGADAAGAAPTAARQKQLVLKPGFLAPNRRVGGKGDSGQRGAVPAARPAAHAALECGKVAASGPVAARSRAPDFDVVMQGGVGADTDDGSSLSLRQLHWEVRTATDSDDDEADDRQQGTSQSEDDEADATTRLLAALGVEASSSDSGGDGDGGGGVRAHRRGGLAVGRGGSVQTGARKPALRQRRRSRDQVQDSMAMAGRPEAAGRAAAMGHISGDGGGVDGFMPLYDSAMHAELAGTTLAQSFDFGLGGSGPGAGAGGAAAAGSSRHAMPDGTATAAGGGDTQGLQPVNLDMNLVRNLLRSYTAQQGGAGPAGNMAAMLGVSLVAGDVTD